jgi:hypothetical protein
VGDRSGPAASTRFSICNQAQKMGPKTGKCGAESFLHRRVRISWLVLLVVEASSSWVMGIVIGKGTRGMRACASSIVHARKSQQGHRCLHLEAMSTVRVVRRSQKNSTP